jgi:hypothetical protein
VEPAEEDTANVLLIVHGRAEVDGRFAGRACAVILAEGRHAPTDPHIETGFPGPNVGLHLGYQQSAFPSRAIANICGGSGN